MDVDREIRAANRRVQALIDEMAAQAWERLGYTREQQKADEAARQAERFRAGLAALAAPIQVFAEAFGALATATQAAAVEMIAAFGDAAAPQNHYPTSEEMTRVRRTRT